MAALTDRRILVSGAGSGLGLALVARFLEEGARVAALEINEAKANALTTSFGGDVVVTVGDATRLADNRQAVAAAVDAFGGLDVFVGNAGVWDYNTALVDLPDDVVDDAFDEVFRLNVKGYLLGAKAAEPELRRSKGAIVFTVSNAGFWPGGGGPLYTASKHAVVGLIRELAWELAPDVRVNGVAAGAMPTDLRGPRALGLHELAFAQLPVDTIAEVFTALERPISPDDYTGHYVLFASERDARTVTGSVHICDGGVGVRGRKLLDDAMARAMEQR